MLTTYKVNSTMTLAPSVPATAPQYKGYIDWVASGFIRGWLYSPDKPNQPVAFKLLLDGTELFQSTADLYREDLEKAGLGNGAHGYCIPHDLSAEQLSGKTLQLASLDNLPIGKSFTVPDENLLDIVVTLLDSTQHYVLNTEIEASEDSVVTLQLFYDNNRFWQGAKALKKGLNVLSLPVCAEIADGKSHSVTLGMLGKVNALWQQSLALSIHEEAIQLCSSVKNTGNKPIIVMIDRSVPKPDQDAGSYAATQEIKLLQSLGFHLVFLPDDFIYATHYTAKLQKMGVEVLYSPYFNNNLSALQSVLPNAVAVYITRYHYVEKYIKAIKAVSNTLPIIFNNADLHFLREIRQANSLNDKVLLQKAMKTRDREVNAMKQVDAILSYSEFEHAVITSHILKSNNIYKCPWVVEPPSEQSPFSAREGVAFLGGYEHPANIEAVEFFIEQVMPLLREKGVNIKVYIYGSHMPNTFHDYACADVIIKGYVESLDDVYLKHRVFVAPLFFGAGVKGKVLTAAAYGMPCVLSSIAIEATGLVHNVSAFVAKEPQEWVDYVIHLYTNEQVWTFIAKNQQMMVKESYSFEHAKNMMKDILQSVNILTEIQRVHKC